MKLLILLVLALALTGCFTNLDTAEDADGRANVNIAALRGPSALGMLRLMDENDNGFTLNNYNFDLLNMPEGVPPLIIRGEVDIAAVPVNLASILYNATGGDVQALVVSTLGVLHIVDTTGEIDSIEDLRGRTVFASAQGATPEFVLNYILNMNGLVPGVDVLVEFRADHTEIAAMLENGLAEIAMLPEPFASTVLARMDNLEAVLDLTEEWNKVQPDYGLVMTAVIGRREFVENNPEAVATFLEEYRRSIEFVNLYTEDAARLAVEYGIIPNHTVAVQALPRSNLVFISGDQMRQYLQGFLQVLYNAAPDSIGGSMPGEGFFFTPGEDAR